MNEIVLAFGIDWRLIAIQVFNFGIMVAVLWYFLYTPVLKMLSDRESKIKKGISDAAEAEKALSTAEESRTQIIKKAHSEAEAIVSRAVTHAEEKEEMMLEETKQRVNRELLAAEATAESIKDHARKESEQEIAKIALLATEKLLNAKLSK